MSEFTAITTQEEFDKAIQKRLAQKDRELAEQYREYLSPEKVEALKGDFLKQLNAANAKLKEAQEKISGFEKERTELQNRATIAETSLLKGKVASKHKIPLELAERLVGANEEELEKDAETFAGFMQPASAAPLRTNDPASSSNPFGGSNQNTAAYAALLAGLDAQN